VELYYPEGIADFGANPEKVGEALPVIEVTEKRSGEHVVSEVSSCPVEFVAVVSVVVILE